MIIGFRLKKNCRLPGHIPTETELKGEAVNDQQTALRSPKEMNMEKMQELGEQIKEQIAEEELEKGGHAFQEARKNKQVDRAWKEASAMAEKYSRKCLARVGCMIKGKLER